MSDTLSIVVHLATALANLATVVIVVKMIVISSQMAKETKQHTKMMERRLTELDAKYPSHRIGRS